MPLDYFKIATDICRKDAERIRRGEHIPQGYVPLARATLCLDCSVLFVLDTTCPNCAGRQVMRLAAWLDRVKTEETS